jgi:hypothetical protein
MDSSVRWGLRRYVTLLTVLMLHVTLIVVLLRAPGAGPLPASVEHPVELLYLSPVSLPKIRSQYAPPRRLNADSVITTAPIAPTGLDSPAMATPLGASSDGKGSGVDWTAEAHRALHSYEIRNHQPPSNASVSGDPGDEWLRQLQRHAGDQVRTPNGDWIVWISANCYQVASSGSSVFAAGAPLPKTICHEQSRAPAP